jgi:hypothetical protein
MVNYQAFEGRLCELTREFQSARPFPHLVVEEFLDAPTAESIYREFPSVDTTFRRHIHLNSHKYALGDWTRLPPSISKACQELNSPEFLHFLSSLTGISPLYADPDLFGGGVHIIRRGGFLNIHADFNDHPVLKKKRCLNALLYFNKDWRPEYRGALELWDREMRHCVRSIPPDFNRCVIFETSTTSFHGHPEPLACPEEVARQSLALYYYTDWQDNDDAPRLVTTDYRLRPNDYARKLRAGARKVLGQRLSDRIGALLPRGTGQD